jgi:hypothetical protein
MKTLAICAVVLMSVAAHAIVLEPAAKLAGSYVAQGNCLYETATVKNERSNKMDFIVVRLADSKTSTFNSRAINMDNMWTKVRTTRGMQRIMTKDMVRGGKMVAEEKTCLPGWIGCSDWKLAMEASLVDENTMEVKMGAETCTFTKAQE